MTNSFIDTFNEYFDMVPAVSDELKNEVYKLRYQVYCLETGFAKIDAHPNGIESDEFDNNSIHYLIRHRKSNSYAATTRLILPNISNKDNLFPIEEHTEFYNDDILKNIPRDNLAEVSRFCVSKEFKRRKKEIGTLTGIDSDWEQDITEDERRVFPHITIALISCLIKISDENGIYYWYAVMEPALIRFLSSLGIYFVSIGPITDYHGKRQPCMIKVSDLLVGVANKNPILWDMITNKGKIGQNIR